VLQAMMLSTDADPLVLRYQATRGRDHEHARTLA
jgi:hypothetical protein